MTIKPRLKDVLWMAAGAAIPLMLMTAVLLFHEERNPDEQLASKARRMEIVGRMRLALASASEAEKSAVLATTDRDSASFADQARAASATVDQARADLAELLGTAGTQDEKDLLGQFGRAFAEFEQIDNALLDLAVKNTNLKAYSLAFGPAAEAVNAMHAALSRIVADNTASPNAGTVTLLASGAEIGALRIQALLAPHISEESDEKMDHLEALMSKESEAVRRDLEGLTALPSLTGNPDLATAAASWARFTDLKTQVLALSRENTNVRSLAISLNRKRKVMLVCQDALAALQRAIEDEPIAGVTYGRPARPR